MVSSDIGERRGGLTKGEGTEQTCFLLLVELVCGCDSVVVVGEVVVCEIGFGNFVEDEYELERVLVCLRAA